MTFILFTVVQSEVKLEAMQVECWHNVRFDCGLKVPLWGDVSASCNGGLLMRPSQGFFASQSELFLRGHYRN
jgi:hypothetical protein